MQKHKSSYDAWLKKAINDLRAAKKLVATPDPIFDMAIYHTQQCAEKALKSFLAFHGILPPKTQLDPDFRSSRKNQTTFTATAVRQPACTTLTTRKNCNAEGFIPPLAELI